MSIRQLDRVFKASRSKNGARLVLLALADYADDSGKSYPSLNGLKGKTQLTERPIQYALRELVALGEIKIGHSEGPKGCNVYHILLPPAESAPPLNQHPRNISATPPLNQRQTPAESAPEPSGTVKEPSDPSFAKPQKGKARASLEECSAFAVEMGLPGLDGEAFFHAKQGNGWKNGENPVRDWKSTFRNWKANGWHPSQKAANPGGYNRNAGTANAGSASDYSRVGKLPLPENASF